MTVTMLTRWLFVLSLCIATGVCSSKCFPGWENHGKSCYSLSNSAATWGAAQATCTASGGKLAEIETSEENSFLKSFVTKQGSALVWIGGTASFRAGTFEWATSHKLLYPFSDMDPSQPDRDGSCLVLWKAASYRWGDAPCQNLYTFLCESELLPQNTSTSGC